MKLLGVYAAVLAAYVVLDLLWVGVVAHAFYHQHLGHLLAKNVTWYAAVLFYLIFVAGVLAFVVMPQHLQSAWVYSGYAAGFGLVTYGTYDLVNLALMRNWSVLATVVDCFWGMLVTLVVAWVGRWCLHALS
jgi:uncharacterized membrane protein